MTGEVCDIGGIGNNGRQAERTALAWRRTSLSVGLGALVALRMLPSEFGAAGVVVGILGVLWSLDLARSSRRRLARAQSLLLGAHPADGEVIGRLLARTTAIAMTAGILSLAGVLALAVGRARG